MTHLTKPRPNLKPQITTRSGIHLNLLYPVVSLQCPNPIFRKVLSMPNLFQTVDQILGELDLNFLRGTAREHQKEVCRSLAELTSPRRNDSADQRVGGPRDTKDLAIWMKNELTSILAEGSNSQILHAVRKLAELRVAVTSGFDVVPVLPHLLEQSNLLKFKDSVDYTVLRLTVLKHELMEFPQNSALTHQVEEIGGKLARYASKLVQTGSSDRAAQRRIRGLIRGMQLSLAMIADIADATSEGVTVSGREICPLTISSTLASDEATSWIDLSGPQNGPPERYRTESAPFANDLARLPRQGWYLLNGLQIDQSILSPRLRLTSIDESTTLLGSAPWLGVYMEELESAGRRFSALKTYAEQNQLLPQPLRALSGKFTNLYEVFSAVETGCRFFSNRAPGLRPTRPSDIATFVAHKSLELLSLTSSRALEEVRGLCKHYPEG